MKLATSLFAVASLVTTALAHGYVVKTVIGGTEAPGFLPFSDSIGNKNVPNKIPTRRILNDGPVEKARLATDDMACNTGWNDARGGHKFRTDAHRSIAPGAKFTNKWDRWPSEHQGPITTWMAFCGTSCKDFDTAGKAVWFKINQVGLIRGDTSTGFWATSKLIADGLQWSVNIPTGLRPGAYLLRTELLALHSAGSPQFYPSCTQIRVTGSGNKFPPANQLHAIEKVYNMSQPGLKNSVWLAAKSYTIAGPPVATLAEGSTVKAVEEDGSGASSSSSGGGAAAASGAKKVCSSKSRRRRRHPVVRSEESA